MSQFESVPEKPRPSVQRMPSRTKVKMEVVRLNAAGQSMPSPIQKELLEFDLKKMDEVDVKDKQVLPTAEGTVQ